MQCPVNPFLSPPPFFPAIGARRTMHFYLFCKCTCVNLDLKSVALEWVARERTRDEEVESGVGGIYFINFQPTHTQHTHSTHFRAAGTHFPSVVAHGKGGEKFNQLKQKFMDDFLPLYWQRFPTLRLALPTPSHYRMIYAARNRFWLHPSKNGCSHQAMWSARSG